jgi:hypothetical protein
MSLFLPPFPENYLIRIDEISEQKADDFNAPGTLLHSYSFNDWRATVLPPFRKIASTKSGMVLLNAFRATGKWTRIRPVWKPECNAETSVAPTKDTVGRYYKTQVLFDPQMYMSGSECYVRRLKVQPKPRAALPDEVLFHELIHAYRDLFYLDSNHTRLHGGLKRYDIVDDFFAIVLTNIYISDASNRHSSGLRADHDGYRPLEKELSNSFTFYQSSPQVLPLMTQLIKENDYLALELSKVKAGCNPLAAYFQNYRAVEALSQSSLAKRREVLIENLRVPARLPMSPLPTVPEATALEAAAKFLGDAALAILKTGF